MQMSDNCDRMPSPTGMEIPRDIIKNVRINHKWWISIDFP